MKESKENKNYNYKEEFNVTNQLNMPPDQKLKKKSPSQNEDDKKSKENDLGLSKSQIVKHHSYNSDKLGKSGTNEEIDVISAGADKDKVVVELNKS